MKRRLMTIMAMIATGACMAQTETWTMDRCMEYAMAHSIGVQKKSRELASLKEDNKAATAAFLPSIGASVGGQYSWGRSIDPETNVYGTVTTFNNSYSLYASIDVFDGGRTINQWKRAKVARRQGMSELQKERDDKAISVMQAFVDAVYYKACVGLAEEKLAESNKTLHLARTQEEIGIKGRPDVAQIEAQVAEDNYNLTRNRNMYQTAVLALKDEMNYPVADVLVPDSALPRGASHGTPANADEIFAIAAVSNPAAESARLNVRNYSLQYSIAKGNLLPTLSLSAGVATNYFRNFSGDAPTSPFGRQFHNNMGEYIYATLNIPIFDNLQRITNVRKAKNNKVMAELDREETMRKLQTDIHQAVMDMEGYSEEVVQMEAKTAADSVAYLMARRKFEEGMLNAIDLQTSANTLLQSRITLLQKRLLCIMKERLVRYYKFGVWN